MLDASIFLAIAAALVSWLDPNAHGSIANNSLVNAGHWVIIFLLSAARIKADSYIKTDVEVTWLLYGFMLGEVDIDCAAAVTLMLLSALAFHRHRRALRLHECEATTPAVTLADDDTAAF
jgi:hypothetical protein